MLYNWGDFFKFFRSWSVQSVGGRLFFYFKLVNYGIIDVQAVHASLIVICLYGKSCWLGNNFIKSTPSSDGRSGPGTVFKALEPISQLSFYYAPFSGLADISASSRREISMELWCYIDRASVGLSV